MLLLWAMVFLLFAIVVFVLRDKVVDLASG